LKKILVAGATGYLGGFVFHELKKRGYWVRILVRNEEQASKLKNTVDDVFIGEVTNPKSLEGATKGIDVVFSSIGITRQKDGLTYQDVDYQGNLNLLHDALENKVERFVYVSVLNAERMPTLKIIQAKERFVTALIDADINHCIIRPTGFFVDMAEMLDLAKKGTIYLFGDGELRGNPISGKDLAGVCCDSIDANVKELKVGGPKVYTQNEIAAIAFSALGLRRRVIYIPVWIIKIILPLLRWFTSSKFYGPIEFFATVLTLPMETDCYGEDLLEDFYQEEAKKR